MLYRLLTSLLYPVFFIYTLKLAIKFKSLTYFKQRLGFAYLQNHHHPIWVHCASVGEINTFMPLLERLIDRLPKQQFIITTNTVTGAYMLNKHAPANTQHSYLPIENRHAITRFLNTTQPCLALIMETEIWPLLYELINDKGIALSIINARLSNKTVNANNWIKKQYRYALTQVDSIFARSEKDLELFKTLGNIPEKSQTVGNLKLSQSNYSQVIDLDNFTQRKYILAASTHEDEEFQLAQLWQSSDLINTLLVIAPRHPDRRNSILDQLKPLKLNISVRSRGDKITEETQIYLADTLGEMSGLMNKAHIIFMGGSLVPHGGQNLLEAARLSRAIVVGPHMHNFQNEVELFKQQHACIQVTNTRQLDNVMQSLLIDDNQRSSLESCAKILMDKQANIAGDYLVKLEECYADVFN